MFKKSFKNIFTVVIVTILALIPAFSVNAEVPYESYTYWSDVGEQDKAVYNRPMYSADFVIDASYLGVEEFSKINDITFDEKGNLYILDNESRIVVLDKDYKVIREIGLINGTESYLDSKGLYIAKDGTIYICDTEGRRILHINNKGKLIDKITLPESNLIPDDFDFRPTNIAIDEYGYTYILSDGSYYGALLFDVDMEFLGFYGANTVSATLGNVFSNIKNRILPNNAKKGNSTKRLPYCFVDLTIDDEGFIYTSTGYTDDERKGQVRKLGPGIGNNILGSDEISFVDTKVNTSYNKGAVSKQDIFDIEVDDNGFVYGLESAFGKVFVYDSSCRILSVFGGGMGFGNQVGTFVTVSALEIQNNGDYVLVADSATNKITVFKITEFGKTIKNLIGLTLDGDYEGAKEGWEEVLRSNSNNQFAYIGLAKAAYSEGNYKEALSLSKQAYDKELYSQAYEQLRKEWLHKNITWIIFLVLLPIVVIAFIIKKFGRKTGIKNEKTKVMLNSLFHPVDSFVKIKQKNLSSVKFSIIILALYYVSVATQSLFGSFMFVSKDAGSFNSVLLLLRTVGLVVLWTVANWAVCSLFGGIGKMKEIFTIVCYSLIPMIISNFLYTILTHVFIPDEVAFISTIMTAITIYSLIMIIIGTIIIHDFSFGKFVGTSLLTILAMAIILFIVVLIIVLVQQLIAFGATIYNEIIFR